MEKNIEYVEHMIKNIDFNKFGYVYGKESLENLIKGYMEQDKYINKLENKLMYALSPTTHELALSTQEHFKEIIRDNFEEDTYTIKRALKEYWKTFK